MNDPVQVQLKPNVNKYMELEIINSLGIIKSQRKTPISKDEMDIIKESQLWEARDDLHLSTYQKWSGYTTSFIHMQKDKMTTSSR
jgi:hypothetical protein